MAADGIKQSNPSRASKVSSETPRVVYKPRPETTPNSELAALAAVYAFIVARYEQKRMAAEAPADANTAEVEGVDKSSEVRPANKGGGRHAREG